jgi:hypothetical protein
LIVDPNYIGGMLNAKVITFSLSKTRALSFTNITEACDFSRKYDISPGLILLDEKLTADLEQVRKWLEDSENICPIHVISNKIIEKEKDGCLVVASELLVHHIGNWFPN